MAEGDNEGQDLERPDEIGQKAGAVQEFKENSVRNKELEAEQIKQKLRAETEPHEIMNKLADNFEAKIRGIIHSVSSTSTELNATARAYGQPSETPKWCFFTRCTVEFYIGVDSNLPITLVRPLVFYPLRPYQSFPLTAEPPTWCIDLGKWPYDASAWRVWLAEKRVGAHPVMH